MKTGPAAMAAARALGIMGVPMMSSPGVAEVFSAPTRKDVAAILGSMAAARRIEADCCLLLNHGFHERAAEDATAGARQLLKDVADMADAADHMLRAYEAQGGRMDRSALHLIAGFDEDKWHDLFTLVGGIAGSLGKARDRVAAEPALRPGRKMAPGMAFIGHNLVNFLEREGLRRSKSERSKMVEAVDTIFRGVGLAGPTFSAQAFVRTILRLGDESKGEEPAD